MRVLHLTPELPSWPGGTGGATRQFHLLARLAELGHEVTVVAPVPAGDDRAGARLAEVGIRLVAYERPRSRMREVAAALAGRPSLLATALRDPVLPWQVSVFWERMRSLADREIGERPPDVVLIEHDNAAAWVEAVPRGIPAVLVLQNSGPDYYRSRAGAARGLRRMLFEAEERRFRRFHRRWLDRYAALMPVSDKDAERIRVVSDLPAYVVPNGVASQELTPASPSREPATILFTGTLNHPPNSEGIVWFAERIWPAIRHARPDAILLVVGRAPPPEVTALGELPGVEVVGPVPDVAPLFERATAVVVPLRSGGGTRLKILEALASGRALVSTSVGCEGLALADGDELLIRDDPETFAAATLRLLAEPKLRERLAGRGREVVAERYDWRVLGDGLANALQQIASPAR